MNTSSCAVVLARYVRRRKSTRAQLWKKNGDSAKRIGKLHWACRAGQPTNGLRQLTSESSYCVGDTRKVRFSPAIGTIVDFMSVSFSNRFSKRNGSYYDHATETKRYWPLLYCPRVQFSPFIYYSIHHVTSDTQASRSSVWNVEKLGLMRKAMRMCVIFTLIPLRLSTARIVLRWSS